MGDGCVYEPTMVTESRIEGDTLYCGHRYKHNYDKTQKYCPECGKQSVWVEDGPGDYYMGPEYFCAACGAGGSCWDGGGIHYVAGTAREAERISTGEGNG